LAGQQSPRARHVLLLDEELVELAVRIRSRPQVPFQVRDEFQPSRPATEVLEGYPPHLERILRGNEDRHRAPDAAVDRDDRGVPDSVAAFVAIRPGLDRLPRQRPELPAV